MYVISKELRFEAAHRLIPPYTGKCSHLHGHCWAVRLYLQSSQLDERGFVRDFSEVAVLRDWIDKNLDHATLVSDRDTHLLDWLRANGQKHFVIANNPTSEMLAYILFEAAQKLGLDVNEVEVRESETSSASYRQS
jgi:6-pyruvoyltetrahydropterin/6-carboxytetrahydropterin synthase